MQALVFGKLARVGVVTEGMLAIVAHAPIDANAFWLSLIMRLLGMYIWNVFSMSRVP